MGDALPLVVSGLKKSYGSVAALHEVSFSLRPGELVGFIGPNGAGKSTTFRTIVGLQAPDGGSVAVGGLDPSLDRIGALRRLGYVGQDLRTFPFLTGEETLRAVARAHGLSADVEAARIGHLLQLVGLEASRHRLVREYSGGMAQKLSLCAAFIHEPPLILLDEAFSGLDPESTAAIRAHLDALRARGTAVLLSSHVLEQLEVWVDRVIMLFRGAVVLDEAQPALGERLREEGGLNGVYLSRVRQG